VLVDLRIPKQNFLSFPIIFVRPTTTLIIAHGNPSVLERFALTSIGVYILSYNRPQYLREAIVSVLGQQRKADRIVVLDNGSGPDVKASISEELKKGVIWIGAGQNHDSLWNHRRVLEVAREDLFYLMHDDDRLLPNFLSVQVDFMERNSEVIASGCNGFLIGPTGKRKGGYVREKSGERIERYSDSASMAELYSRSYIPFPSVVYRNGFPQKIGFEEKYGQFIDAVFLVRLAGIGQVVFLDEDLIEYRMHAGQDSTALREDQYRMKEEILLQCTRDDTRYSRKVKSKIMENQTRRWLERIVSAAMVHRSLREASIQILTTRPDHLDILGLIKTILLPSRYFRRLINTRGRID
jgi:glycosyltransferase involved in cell wall biosynthesis